MSLKSHKITTFAMKSPLNHIKSPLYHHDVCVCVYVYIYIWYLQLRKGHLEVVRLLLKGRADQNKVNHNASWYGKQHLELGFEWDLMGILCEFM